MKTLTDELRKLSGYVADGLVEFDHPNDEAHLERAMEMIFEILAHARIIKPEDHPLNEEE